MTEQAETHRDSASNPYVGPRAFTRQESRFFFGRDQEIEILTGQVLAHPASLFFAQSGAGKSSLLNAGLIPRLTRVQRVGRGERARLYQKTGVIPVLRVGRAVPPRVERPIANVYVFSALQELLPGADPDELADVTLADALADVLAREAERFEASGAAGAETGRARPRRVRPEATLLIFDQFEELFTAHAERWPEREDLFKQVDQALARHPALHVLFSMREDYIAELTPYANLLPDSLRYRFRMERLGRDAALLAVVKPARRAGRDFAGGVAEDLVDNLRRVQPGKRIPPAGGRDGASALGAYVEPVHLQIVCRQLWASLPPERTTILAEDVQEFGDVDQALMGFYESALAEALAAPGVNVGERVLRGWFETELITPARTKGLVYRGDAETRGLPNPAVDSLNDAYIIRAEVRGGDTWYELAHDRLVEPVLDSNRAWRSRYYNPLEQPTQAWLAAGRAPGKLLEGAGLKEAQAYAEGHPLDVTEQEQDFLQAARRAARWRRFGIITTIFIAAALAGLIAWALISQAETRKQASIAQARQLAAQSQSALDTDPTQALLLAEQAVTTTWNLKDGMGQQLRLAEVDQALRDSLQAPQGRPLSGHKGNLLAARLSPDGRWLAAAGTDPNIWLWDTVDINASPRVLDGHKDRVGALDFSHDGRWLASGSADGTARLWDLETGAELHVLGGHQGEVLALDISPDGHRLATGGTDGTVRLWDTETGEQLNVLKGHDASVSAVKFSPDGRLLATASDDKTARLWDTESGEELQVLNGHTEWLKALEFSPDGHWLATGGGDGTTRLWDVTTGDELANLAGHEDSVTALSFSPNGRWLATSSRDKTARLWDPETGQVRHVLRGHEDWVNALEFSPDSDWLATASDDRTARLWEVETGDELHVLHGHEGGLDTVEFSRDGRWLATSSQVGSPRLWNVDDLSPEPRVLRGHQAPVNEVIFSSDGRWLATAGDDGTARLWDPATGESRQVLNGHGGSVIALSFSPDGRWLATGGEDAIARLWDPQTGEEHHTLGGHRGPVLAVSFSPDGRRLATASTDSTARLWDVATGSELATLARHKHWVNALSFSPDGRWLATASEDGTALLWDAETGEVRHKLDHGGREVSDLAFSPDGRWLATASGDGTARLWDVRTGEERHVLLGHEERVKALSFSRDGRWLATASRDKTARVWDITGPSPLPVVLHGHEDWLNAIAFSPDGRWLATASQDGTARLWRQDLRDLTGLACQMAARNFRIDEWERFFGRDIPYTVTCPDWPADPAASASTEENQGE